MPLLMHNGQNDDFIRVNTIEQTIREAADQTAPDAGIDNWPAIRCYQDVAQGRFDTVKEILPKAGGLLLIITGGVEQFLFGR